VVELIRQNPGITVTQIMKSTNANRSTLLYHLNILERHRNTHSKTSAGFRRFFPTEIQLSKEETFSTPTTDKIWKIIKRNPGSTIKDLSEITGTSRQALHHQLTRLLLDHRVDWQREGRTRKWFVED